ncbi:hypothetical protein AYK24_05135 [Thermoplasmatales archaeon SG8-52-4]|nr:MAG: hypothetical protein AYK24_05135 [Thermoplasmatales archaeon SG8-52-4]
MGFEKKGMLAPFTILTSLFTGMGFPLIGSLIAIDLGVVNSLYINGVVLVLIGGFLAHWVFAHAVHDYYHYDIEKRVTFSKKSLIILFVISLIILLSIAIYLTLERGWPVMVFAIIGGVMSMYAEGLLHHESQMAFGAMFLVIGAFYVQAASLNLDLMVWLQVLCIALFAFFSQYGWLLIYRLDDYKYNEKKKNISIIVTKTSIIFLILYFIL